jgi:hypothetical protein
MNQTVYIGISIYIWIVEGFARLFSLVFFIHVEHPPNILSPEQVFIPAVSILKIANIHVGTRKPILSLATGFYSRQMYFHTRCSNMNTSIIHVGTIHRNVRISNWAVSYFHISFIFYIFISVSYFHISFIFSPFGWMVPTWTFDIHTSFIFSYQFHIFISVCNSHVTTPSLPYVWLRNQSATRPIETDNFPMLQRWNWSHQTKTNVHVGT